MSAQSASAILFYEGPHYYLSNFSSFALVLASSKWMTVEHAYQALKFPFKWGQDLRTQIRVAPSAHEAKQIAKQNKGFVRLDWDKVKLSLMEKLLWAKYDQHPYIRRKLLETGTDLLIEDSPKDSFWGRGPDLMGSNHLGRLWMKIRSEEQQRIAHLSP